MEEGAKKTVLVVDDVKLITKMSKRRLEQAFNVDVLTANTVEEGIEIISAERGKIAILVSDWDISTNDGAWAEVIRAGKEAGIEKIIGTSGRAGHESVDSQILEVGATVAIVKDTDILTETVRAMLGDVENVESTEVTE